jgi:hypothetical protein
MPEWISKILGIGEEIPKQARIALEWLNLPPMWVLFLVLIPGIYLLAHLIYRLERRDVARSAKLVLSILRAALVVLILLMLFGPILSVETKEKSSSYIAVLVDESASMRFVDRIPEEQKIKMAKAVLNIAEPSSEDLERLEGLSRLELIKKAFTNHRILERLSEKMKLKTFAFAGNLREIEDIKDLHPSGNLTAIGNSLRNAYDRLKGQYISAFLLISDGKNNYGQEPIDVAKTTFYRRRIPIYTVAPGKYTPPKDIELSRLEAREEVYEEDQLTIKFTIKSKGFQTAKTDIYFRRYKIPPDLKPQELPSFENFEKLLKVAKEAELLKDLTQSNVELSEEAQEITVSMKTPKLPKDKEFEDYLLIIHAEGSKEEVSDINNYLLHKVRVSKERIRILYVEGTPRHEYKFLKNALIRDKSLEVQTFLISSDPDFPNEVSIHLLKEGKIEPLTKFPSTMQELLKYDVLIIGDVSLRELARYSERMDKDKLAKNIAEFVGKFRGGLILIAGPRDNPRSFYQTELANLLPVIMEDDYYRFMELGTSYIGEYIYKLTEEGKHSTITKMKPNPRENELFWRGEGKWALPGVRWFLRSKGSRKHIKQKHPLALVLVEAVHPREGIGSQGNPIFLTRFYGGGRVFFAATDESWLWRKKIGDYYYYKFWRQVIDWVRGAKIGGLKRYEIVQFDKKQYNLNEDVNIEIKAYTEKFEPMMEPELKIFIDLPVAPGEIERKELSLSLDEDRPGRYKGIFRPTLTGTHRVWIQYMGERGELKIVERKFKAIVENKEDEDPIIDEDALRELSKESIGRRDKKLFYRLEEIADLPEKIEPGELVKIKRREEDIWDSPLIWILFALLITTEWVIRKINRML